MRKTSQQPADAEVVSAPHKGMVLGRYELIRPLGHGGMAQVWLARKRLPGGGTKICALKMVLDLLNDNESQRSGLINEIKLSSVLSHSNIVQVYDAGVIGRVVFIEMERVDGVDLKQVLARLRLVAQPFSFELAALIARECLQGLYYAHTLEMDGRPAAIVHRDVSPSNILVSSMGEVKIMDFGVGKFEADLTSGGNMLRGKLGYMAPEQPAGINTAKADIFALGAVFYEMLTGRPFRERTTQAEALSAAMGGLVPDLDIPGLPLELLDFYRGCTERDHHRRFDAKAALAQLKKWRAVPADAADLQSLYARHIDGGRHSGYTQAEIALPPGYRALLEAIQAAAVAEQTGEFEGASAEAGRDPAGPGRSPAAGMGIEPTRPDELASRRHSGSEPDAPVVFRRASSPRPIAPGTTLSLDGPPVAKRGATPVGPPGRRPAPASVAAPPRAATPVVGPAGNDAPVGPATRAEPIDRAAIVDPNARTLQLESGAVPPAVDATAVLSATELHAVVGEPPRSGTPVMDAAVHQPVTPDATATTAAAMSGPDAATSVEGETVDDGRLDVRRMLIVAATAVALGVAAVVWVLIGVPRPGLGTPSSAGLDARGTAEERPDAVDPPSVVDAPVTVTPSGPVLEPHQPEVDPRTTEADSPELTSEPAAAEAPPPPEPPAVPEVATAPTVVPPPPADDPKVTPKKPKPKPVPKVETRLAPNVEVDVEIDGKVHTLTLASKDVQLAVGKHNVRWRPKQDTVWRDAPPLKLEAGMRYMLRIGPTSVKVTSSKAVTP